MSVIDHNITIYGKGLLKRPFISLKDFVRSIVNLTTYKQKKTFEVFNQYTELLCIKNLGAIICSAAKKNGSKSAVKLIKNPRVEKETHQMQMENKKFLKILKSKPIKFSREINFTLKDLFLIRKK